MCESFNRCVSIAAFLILSAVRAGDWPQWGNTLDRNMISSEVNLPGTWSPGTPQSDDFIPGTDKNVKWGARLGTICLGSPIIAGGKVFIGTNNGQPRNPALKVDCGVLMCFDEDSGRFLWQLAVPKLNSKTEDGPQWGICSSPAVEAGRAYVVSNRDELICMDVNGTGADKDILWRLDMMNELGASPRIRSTCSPLIDGDFVFVCTGNGSHRALVNDAPSVVAVNKKDGKIVWKDSLGLEKGARADCGLSRRIFSGQWSSLSIGTVNGSKQLYFGAGDGVVYALDPQSGKTIWSADCVLPEFRKNQKGFILYPDYKGPNGIAATPVFHNNRVYIASGDDPDKGEGLGVLTCIDATKSGDVTESGKLWVYKKISRSLSTVSIQNGLLFAADFGGNVHCLDAETGAVQWVFESGSHIWGSTMVADGMVYCGTEDGELIILEAGKTLRVIGRANAGTAIYSTPAPANGAVYVASQSHLFAITKK